jgi:hypothetical protein
MRILAQTMALAGGRFWLYPLCSTDYGRISILPGRNCLCPPDIRSQETEKHLGNPQDRKAKAWKPSLENDERLTMKKQMKAKSGESDQFY